MKKLICRIFGHKPEKMVVRKLWRGIYCGRCYEWLEIWREKE
jgi:hypothetical protein